MLLYLLASLVLPFIHIGECVFVRLLLPEAVKAGNSATLVCQFDLDGQQLYSVKWYRGNFEFFRFIPRERPPGMAFRFPGINVDEAVSSAHQVVLLRIPANIGGRFLCEVSAEGPRFTTASDHAELHVIDVRGIRRPEVQISSNFYDRNNLDKLAVNCSSHPTLPPPLINFYINEDKVNPEWIEIVNAGLAILSPKSIGQWLEARSTTEPMSTVLDYFDKEPANTEPTKELDTKDDYDSPLCITCEALVPDVYQLFSSEVPIFPQIDEPVNSGKQIRMISTHGYLATSMFLLNCIVIILLI